MAASDKWPVKYLPTEGRGARVLNPDYVALWEPYLAEGMSGKAVAEVFGVAKHTVYKYYPGRGWTNSQAGQLGTAMKYHNQRMRTARFAKQA